MNEVPDVQLLRESFFADPPPLSRCSPRRAAGASWTSSRTSPSPSRSTGWPSCSRCPWRIGPSSFQGAVRLRHVRLGQPRPGGVPGRGALRHHPGAQPAHDVRRRLALLHGRVDHPPGAGGRSRCACPAL